MSRPRQLPSIVVLLISLFFSAALLTGCSDTGIGAGLGAGGGALVGSAVGHPFIGAAVGGAGGAVAGHEIGKHNDDD
jgi:uncharacterized membrane protein